MSKTLKGRVSAPELDIISSPGLTEPGVKSVQKSIYLRRFKPELRVFERPIYELGRR